MTPLTVFISSTFSDLISHRDVLNRELRRAGHKVERMEDFGSSGATPLDACLSAIDRSDVVVLLIGHRYGSIIPNGGVSYTEAEYEYAQASGYQIFAYIRDGFDLAVEASTEGDDPKRRLLALRATVEEEVVVPYKGFTTPADLSDRILTDVSKWAKPASARPVFDRPLLDIDDSVAYASKRVYRDQAPLLAPPVVLVDLSAAELETTPGPRSGRLAAKLWKIKIELEERGHKVHLFTDLATAAMPTSRFDQRLAQVLRSNAVVVLFAKGAADLALLDRFDEGGSARFVWYRDHAPPGTFPADLVERWTGTELTRCMVAIRVERAVEDRVYRHTLAALGSGV